MRPYPKKKQTRRRKVSIDWSYAMVPKEANRLYGEDLTEFKQRVRRSGRCVVCRKLFPDGMISVSHIKSRGAGGGDTDNNCEPMCFWCHRGFEDGRIYLDNDGIYKERK
jgi:5-methylcytosine-specific restriction endonuclease McrA